MDPSPSSSAAHNTSPRKPHTHERAESTWVPFTSSQQPYRQHITSSSSPAALSIETFSTTSSTTGAGPRSSPNLSSRSPTTESGNPFFRFPTNGTTNSSTDPRGTSPASKTRYNKSDKPISLHSPSLSLGSPLRRRLTPQSILSKLVILIPLSLLYLLLRHSPFPFSLPTFPPSTYSGTTPLVPSSSSSSSTLHPLPSLLNTAAQTLNSSLLSRPKNLREAYSAYLTLHAGRSPPKGWDAWFYYTQEVDSCRVVEGFDGLYEAMKVWWGVEAAVVRERNGALRSAMGEMRGMGRVAVQGGKVSREMGGKRTEGVEGVLRELVKDGVKLPDVELFINELDEARVLLPYESKHNVETAARLGTPLALISEEPFFQPLSSTETAYSLIRRVCPPTSLARTTSSPSSLSQKHTSTFSTSLVHFISNHSLELSSFCDQPDLEELIEVTVQRDQVDWTENLWPVFSSSKLEGFSDMLIPDFGEVEEQYDEEKEVDWKGKTDKLFWRGHNSTTSSDPLASRLVGTTNPDPPSSSSSSTTWSPLLLSSFSQAALEAHLPTSSLSLALTNIAYLPSTLPPPSQSSLTLSLAHKAVLSLSFTTLLPLQRTSSALFHSRLRRTWLDSSLIPWAHYIPLSLRQTELFSLLTYFFSTHSVLPLLTKSVGIGKGKIPFKDLARASKTVAHEEELREVGKRGKEWARDCVRDVDRKVWVWLMVLEWGRLGRDGRDGEGFVLGKGEGL